jgi:D-serine deaminase-like pyridoxal phosphate-dependent protein
MGRVAALETLETPALILDRVRLVANCERMRAHLARFGVALRPHVKTAKSVEVARLMHGGASGPVTVSTLKEAEFFLAHGFDDVLYAVGLAPNKFARVAALARAGARLQVIVDSAAMASAFRDFCGSQGLRVPVLIEIDSDEHRAGIQPDSEELLRTAAALDELFGGVLTHAGKSYDSKSAGELRQWARTERESVTAAAARLRRAGHEVPAVSLGSTPTALFGESFEGVTEVRAGVYVFFDLVMAGLGVCSLGELALSVLASVIGHQADKGWLVTDAGWMALSRDRGTQGQRVDQGYGLVCDARGEPLGDLIVVDANQEHGTVAARSGERLDVRKHPVGSLLRVLPNHACATAAQHAAYHVLGARGEIEERWERLHGW